MKIHIISVGKLSGELDSLASRYRKMTNWQIKDTELAHSKKTLEKQIREDESKLIRSKISKDSNVVSLDLSGKQVTSDEFSQLFSKQLMSGRGIDFIIGGAFGLDKSILELSDVKLCLSKMTFTHQIAKLLLFEQIYRAQTILKHHPYHK